MYASRHFDTLQPSLSIPAASMLCKACTSINFDKALCSPEFGGAPLQTYNSLEKEALAGCELCKAIRDKSNEGQERAAGDELILVCVWNWFEGPEEDFRGSAVIIFFQRPSNWSVTMGVFIDEGSFETNIFWRFQLCSSSRLTRAYRFCACGEKYHKWQTF